MEFASSHWAVGEGNGNPLQYSCLENPRGRGAWWAAVCGVAQSWTRLKRLSSSSSMWLSGKKKNPPFDAGDVRDTDSIPGSGRSSGEGTPSSVLAWRIPWTEEPGGLPSMGSHRVGHD